MTDPTPTSARPADPSIAQLREVTQPPSVRTRAGAEHWVASAYLRDVSYYIDAALAIALLAFTATLVAVRYVTRGGPF